LGKHGGGGGGGLMDWWSDAGAELKIENLKSEISGADWQND
jgi:hypothetical protein